MRASGVFLRGMAMGAADIVPGVSGGTVAFITGIYPTLLASLRSIDLYLVRLFLRGDIAGCWRHVNGGFLLMLLLGIATSLLSLARLISYLLDTWPEPLWSLFFGLILASALVLLRQVERWNPARLLALATGLAVALLVGLSPQTGFVEGAAGIFLAGFIAICAMILPGISGSFILVLLGMYATVLAALKSLEIGLLLLFISGAVCGLLCFSRLLYWLLHHFRELTIALLTGFLFGSLVVVWPWKTVLSWIQGSSGALKPAQQWPVMPSEYLARTGDDPMLLVCLLAMVAGFALVWWVDHHGGRLQVELQ
jgi:putative membrane protein